MNIFISVAVSDCSFYNPDTSSVPNRVPEDRSNESAEQKVAADEKKPNWKSTVSATAKLILRGVRDSADAFGPLKSVAGGLCFILENCEVWPSPYPLFTMLTGVPVNECKSTSGRIVGTQGQGPFCLTLHI